MISNTTTKEVSLQAMTVKPVYKLEVVKLINCGHPDYLIIASVILGYIIGVGMAYISKRMT